MVFRKSEKRHEDRREGDRWRGGSGSGGKYRGRGQNQDVSTKHTETEDQGATKSVIGTRRERAEEGTRSQRHEVGENTARPKRTTSATAQSVVRTRSERRRGLKSKVRRCGEYIRDSRGPQEPQVRGVWKVMR